MKFVTATSSVTSRASGVESFSTVLPKVGV
jgi:hypothetical protein